MENRTNTATITIREQVANKLDEQIELYAQYGHDHNYHKLYISRTGEMGWSEFTDSNSGLIDREADGFAEMRYFASVGTGSGNCDCDLCEQGCSPQDSGDWQEIGSAIQELLQASLDDIPVGYFNDEED